MLKIYNLYQNRGKIELADYIKFQNGRFFTGYNGYGDIFTKENKTIYASHILQSLKSFKEYLQSIQLEDGYLQNFLLYNLYNYTVLNEITKDIPKTNEDYKKFGLNEEAILLFTDYISLKYDKNQKTKKLFGRNDFTGMYLLMPGATFEAGIDGFHRVTKETFEVMQSKNIGRQLVLTKLNREIK